MISIGCFESTKSRSSSATFSLRIAGARGTHFFLLCSNWWRLGNMHSVALRSARVSESDSCWKAPVCTWPSRVPNELPFCAIHKPFRTKTLNQPVPFLDSPLIQLAAAVNKVLMSSTAILLSQCFLTEVSFFEDFCKDRGRKTFLFFFFSPGERLNMTGLPTLNHWLRDAPRWLRSLTPALFLLYMRRIIRNERDCGMSFEMHVCLQWYRCSRLLEASALSALNCIYLRSAQNSNAFIENDGIVMFLQCFLWSLSFLLSSHWKAKLNVRWYDSLIMKLLTGWRLRRIKWNTFSLQRSLLVFPCLTTLLWK